MVDKLSPQISMAKQGATLTGVNITVLDKTYRWNLSPIIVDENVQLIIAQGQDVTTLVNSEKQSENARVKAEELARIPRRFSR